ncbi:DNA cytosine methyltransferase [Mobilitalea sibirica]|uniref:Cytosine-specific methyltransferase n=1 Tax=Mobilitalea sibirica TaxID=1462919 RepID=A0A8J7KS10_9FIRM|nr:DNA cytosine methyltransferase [Mobilitalea sibirica]MBH1939846.1 DNA cytosine methyltransferase [Mobilitalea sibirica]
MIDLSNFKLWLTENKDYSVKTISNHVSRFKRADNILPWFNDTVYQFRLEQSEAYQALSVDVRSQIKKAVKLYFEFVNSHETLCTERQSGMKLLSLFANIGVAEAYLKEIGIDVVIANELVERRAILYSKIYPETHMICGDITNREIFDKIVRESVDRGVNIIMATPPCQGMSTVGQKVVDDERNRLVCQVIDAIKEIKPKYALIENVPMFFNTEIKVGDKKILIPELLESELGNDYIINGSVIDTKDYSVPQSRERAIVLLTRKAKNKEWIIPEKDEKVITMRDAIGDLPKLDPFVTDVDEKELLKIFPHYYERRDRALQISKWHKPPHHIKRQVVAMQHTPSGKTAFDNPVFYPVKSNGEAVKGFRNTYKRQNWDTPAYTVTMDNRKISSQDNVHPGREEYIDENGDVIYSDARALTLYELMKIMSIPSDWPVPENTSEAFLRRIIGEGIPPLFVKKVFEKLI